MLMKLLQKTVDLHSELLGTRMRQLSENEILEHVSDILAKNQVIRENILSRILSGNETDSNNFNFGLLETDRIFHLDHIRKICIAYRLRFLPSHYFRDGIPEEAVTRARDLEDRHRTTLGGFHIVAPTKTFQLKNFNDPLLFAPIGNGYFYLVHKWGDDLSFWRKFVVWPYRSLFTFTIVSIFMSLVITWLTPESNLSRRIPMADVIIFLFAFKSVFAIGLYSFFILGKKFNSSIWNSVYFND